MSTPQLATAKLGRNGPQVNRLGFGTMGLSAFYGKPMSDDKRFALLDAAYEAGEHFWDSADMYGDSEDLLGKWFKQNTDKRDNIFLATKFANKMLEDGTRFVLSLSLYPCVSLMFLTEPLTAHQSTASQLVPPVSNALDSLLSISTTATDLTRQHQSRRPSRPWPS